MDELGVADDFVYLGLRAVASHVVLTYDVVQGCALVDAVDDVPEYLLLALGANVAAEEYLPERRPVGALVPVGHSGVPFVSRVLWRLCPARAGRELLRAGTRSERVRPHGLFRTADRQGRSGSKVPLASDRTRAAIQRSPRER